MVKELRWFKERVSSNHREHLWCWITFKFQKRVKHLTNWFHLGPYKIPQNENFLQKTISFLKQRRTLKSLWIHRLLESMCPNTHELMDEHGGYLPLPSTSSRLSLPQVSCPLVFAVFCRLSTSVQYWWGLEVRRAAGHAVRGAAYTGTVLEVCVFKGGTWMSFCGWARLLFRTSVISVKMKQRRAQRTGR